MVKIQITHYVLQKFKKCIKKKTFQSDISNDNLLPEQTDADPAAGRQPTETKPLLAVNVCEHKREVLAHLSLGHSAAHHKERK